jgi:invasion protein IalB
MIRLAFLLLVTALGYGSALAGPQGEGPAPAPKAAPPEQATAASKAPTKDAAKKEAVAGGERIGDWTLFCPEPKDKTKPASCTLEQLLIDAGTQKVAFHLAMGHGPRGNLILIVRAPLGIALVRGLEVTFGGQAVQRAPFTTCEPRGCQAVLILSPALQQEMRKADKALVTVYAPTGGAFQAAASLKGLGEAIDTLNKRRGPS